MSALQRKSKKTTYKKTLVPRVRKQPKPVQKSTLKPGFERLERYLAHAGIASRREAKQLILDGAVFVNKKKVTEPGFGVRPEIDEITLDNNSLPQKEAFLFFKPRGIETSATSDGSTDIRKKYPEYAHLSPIGRLDKDSTGIIILSNDGTLARALTKEDSTVEKEYLVQVREVVTDTALHRMADGIVIDGVSTKPAITARKGRHEFSIILTEGRKHQIRRMCDACRLTITQLTRVRIGHLKAGKMFPGNVKPISPKDCELLKQ